MPAGRYIFYTPPCDAPHPLPPPRPPPQPLYTTRSHIESGPTALPRAPQSRQLPSYHPSLGAGLREEHVVDEVRLLEAALGREPSLHEQRLDR